MERAQRSSEEIHEETHSRVSTAIHLIALFGVVTLSAGLMCWLLSHEGATGQGADVPQGPQGPQGPMGQY